jgi:RPA family protein
LHASAPANGRAVISRAAVAGTAMVWQHLGYSFDQPSTTDQVDAQYSHLWSMAALYHAKKFLHGVASASTVYSQLVTELQVARAARDKT